LAHLQLALGHRTEETLCARGTWEGVVYNSILRDLQAVLGAVQHHLPTVHARLRPETRAAAALLLRACPALLTAFPPDLLPTLQALWRDPALVKARQDPASGLNRARAQELAALAFFLSEQGAASVRDWADPARLGLHARWPRRPVHVVAVPAPAWLRRQETDLLGLCDLDCVPQAAVAGRLQAQAPRLFGTCAAGATGLVFAVSALELGADPAEHKQGLQTSLGLLDSLLKARPWRRMLVVVTHWTLFTSRLAATDTNGLPALLSGLRPHYSSFSFSSASSSASLVMTP
jgi:hypothetical protein